MSEQATRPPVEVTIHGYLDNYHVELSLCLPVEALPEAIRRLAAAGIAPAPAASATNGKGPMGTKAPQRSKDTPLFDDEGAPLCPVHNRPMKEGRYGWFCSAKDENGKNGYCSEKYKD